MTVNGVPLEQVREHLRAGEIVDPDDLDVIAARGNASHAASDASKAVDSDFRRHFFDSSAAREQPKSAAAEGGT